MGNYPIKWSRKPYGRELSVLHATPIPKYTGDVGNAEDGGWVWKMAALPVENNGPAIEHKKASSINEAAASSTRYATPPAVPHPVTPVGMTEPTNEEHSDAMVNQFHATAGEQGGQTWGAGTADQVAQPQSVTQNTNPAQGATSAPVWDHDEYDMEEDDISEMDDSSEYMYESEVDSDGSDA
ncbi:hypothetical protein OE88DRAFT_1735745 [Heliocybe sulcata]|uniref:Uncharacterized protein n=1 Tax=Heliocybe sulcata TaxID=5364 RepID=A0A5C3N098_9AGAM|nr:hypothetical protein OE88DRAFT_1735745 [Heliocybe sulcata]